MKRLQGLRRKLEEKQLDCFLVTGAENRRYMSGFTGSAGALVVTEKEALLLTDFRYVEQASQQASEFTIIRYDDLTKTLSAVFQEHNISKVGFESDIITHHQFAGWQEGLSAVEWVPTREVVEELRMFKDENEIRAMEEAAAIADAAWSELLVKMVPGASERELALELEFIMRRRGAEGLAFDVILASGPNGALPHARPGDRVLTEGDLVVMDFGARFDGYCSDMTRTVCIGKADEKSRKIYDIVLEAQLASLSAVGPGKTGQEVDAIARRVITEAGYGEQFGHGLGHGVGLAIHEEPRLSPKGNKTLKPGMVVTVEPGIYLPGLLGVRIEDLVLVTEDGYRVLNHSTKDFLELG